MRNADAPARIHSPQGDTRGLLHQRPDPDKFRALKRGLHAKTDSPVAGADAPKANPHDELGPAEAAYSVSETPELRTPRRGPHAKPGRPVAVAGPPAGNPREFGLVKAAYSVDETLELLSIGRTLLYRLVASGALRVTKLGKKTLFCASDIAQFLAQLREAS
jgi:excisionase family DNA binding protein